MDKTKRWIKNNLVFFISLVGIALAVIFSVSIMQIQLFNEEVSSTRVGHIRLGSDEDRYQTILEQEIPDYLDECVYTLSYQNKDMAVNFDYVSFLTDETIRGLDEDENNPAVFEFTDATMFSSDITTTYGTPVSDAIHHENLQSDILAALSDLRHAVRFDLNDYMRASDETITLASVVMDDLPEDLVNALRSIDAIDVAPDALFSLLGATNETGLDNEALSLLATMMLKTALKAHFTDFSFDENPGVKPTWADDEFYVSLMRENHFDLTFFNPFDQAYTFTIVPQGDKQMVITLLGLPYVNTYTINKVSKRSIQYPTEYVTDTSIDDTTDGVIISETDTEMIYRVLLQEGQNGTIYEYVRTVMTPGGTSFDVVLLYRIDSPTPRLYAENIIPKAGE